MGQVSDLVHGGGVGENALARLLAEFNGHITQENVQARSLDADYVLTRGSITAVLLGDDSVTSRVIAANAVGTSEIANNTVTEPKLSYPATVAALPGAPRDGLVVDYVADSPTGTIWRLRWRAAVGRWEFVGGSALQGVIPGLESTTSTAYTDLATAGPTVTAPFDGEYMVEWGATMTHAIAQPYVLRAAVKFGAAGPFDTNSILVAGPSGGGAATGASVFLRRRYSGITAGMVLKLQYDVAWGAGVNSADFANRSLAITPMRVQ